MTNSINQSNCCDCNCKLVKFRCGSYSGSVLLPLSFQAAGLEVTDPDCNGSSGTFVITPFERWYPLGSTVDVAVVSAPPIFRFHSGWLVQLYDDNDELIDSQRFASNILQGLELDIDWNQGYAVVWVLFDRVGTDPGNNVSNCGLVPIVAPAQIEVSYPSSISLANLSVTENSCVSFLCQTYYDKQIAETSVILPCFNVSDEVPRIGQFTEGKVTGGCVGNSIEYRLGYGFNDNCASVKLYAYWRGGPAKSYSDNFVDVDIPGYVAMAACAIEVTILDYDCPEGYNGSYRFVFWAFKKLGGPYSFETLRNIYCNLDEFSTGDCDSGYYPYPCIDCSDTSFDPANEGSYGPWGSNPAHCNYCPNFAWRPPTSPIASFGGTDMPTQLGFSTDWASFSGFYLMYPSPSILNTEWDNCYGNNPHVDCDVVHEICNANYRSIDPDWEGGVNCRAAGGPFFKDGQSNVSYNFIVAATNDDASTNDPDVCQCLDSDDSFLGEEPWRARPVTALYTDSVQELKPCYLDCGVGEIVVDCFPRRIAIYLPDELDVSLWNASNCGYGLGTDTYTRDASIVSNDPGTVYGYNGRNWRVLEGDCSDLSHESTVASGAIWTPWLRIELGFLGTVDAYRMLYKPSETDCVFGTDYSVELHVGYIYNQGPEELPATLRFFTQSYIKIHGVNAAFSQHWAANIGPEIVIADYTSEEIATYAAINNHFGWRHFFGFYGNYCTTETLFSGVSNYGGDGCPELPTPPNNWYCAYSMNGNYYAMSALKKYGFGETLSELCDKCTTPTIGVCTAGRTNQLFNFRVWPTTLPVDDIDCSEVEWIKYA